MHFLKYLGGDKTPERNRVRSSDELGDTDLAIRQSPRDSIASLALQVPATIAIAQRHQIADSSD
jgi:hypothetical protein